MITANCLLHMLMVWEYSIQKSTKRNALTWNKITNTCTTFNDEIKFIGCYKYSKSEMFKDLYDLVDLKIEVNSELVLHFKNVEFFVPDDELEYKESLPILNGVIADKFTPFSEIFNKFKRIV